MTPIADVLTDLNAEYERLNAILTGLSDDQWRAQSSAPGWSICDVVIHLAVSEEGVAETINRATAEWTHWDGDMDDAMAAMVDANQADPDHVLARWQNATDAAVRALAQADPARKVSWAAAPLRPRTLATTRLAEHWAHGLDITGPFGIDFPDTDRLRHIAWLGHATIPYGCSLQGIDPQPVRAELVGPSGQIWRYGPEDAPSSISGTVGAFCRVGAQRLSPADSGLECDGPFSEQALRVLRNYAA